MTQKIYRSAQGKLVDIGALILQNEHVRAVGNMSVNARGDLLDSQNRVIDQKNLQVQREYQRRSTNVSSDSPVHSSSLSARSQPVATPDPIPVIEAMPVVEDIITDDPELEDPTPVRDIAPLVIEEAPLIVAPAPVAPRVDPLAGGGLAAAMAKAKEVKQELEKTPRQKAQAAPLKRI
jgi:hypothetical protein